MGIDTPPIKKPALFRRIDDAPFAGRFLLEGAYVDYITSPDGQKTKRMLGTTALFGALSVVHFAQSWLGVAMAQRYTQDIIAQGPDIKNVGFLAIDAVYAATMAVVGLRQAAHVPRFISDYRRWRIQKDIIPEEKRVPRKRERITKARDMLAALAITAAGQAAFLATAFIR